MDWPIYRYHRPVISSIGPEAVGVSHASLAGVTLASAAWPSANRAIYVPFSLAGPYLAKVVWWTNGATATGNIDCGIYTFDGTLLANAGTTASSGTTTSIQQVSLGTAVLLSPGRYYMAMSCSSASNTALRSNAAIQKLQMMGVAQQASAVPLPATFTQATVGSAYLPVFGIASTTSF